MDTIALLRNVTKTFAGKKVLDEMNLEIRDGEILALLGPNGSGKTTLLKILASILKPSSGEVYFNGVMVTDQNIEKVRMESTMVFQKTVLFGTSVYDNIAYGLKIRRVKKREIDEKVMEVLGLVRLEGFEKRPARRLSGGEQQRVALARALALNTRLLLLDEPTANLDPKNAGIIEEVIRTANQGLKTTIVLATHNMFQARNMPSRIALIADGRLGEVGAPAEIFGRLSKTLASFAATENTFTGEATATDHRETVVSIGNGVKIEATGLRSGHVSVFVSPEDIVLSKNPFASSARNTLKGKVVEILDVGPVVKLKIDAGKRFTVQVTKRSFSEMELNLETEVFLTFKASSVQAL